MASSLNSFPRELKDFGYAFNIVGQLRRLDAITGEPGDEEFQYVVSRDSDYNQRHYEAIGEVITEYVYGLLESGMGLIRLPIPINGGQASSFIFASPDALVTTNPVVLLIHGSGVVRAGQWSRSVIVNNSLKAGTQVPYIEKARSLGYGVLVLNSNDNKVMVNGKLQNVKGSSTPPDHVKYVWKNYVEKAASRHMLIVAHSYGGFNVVELAKEHFNSFKEKCVAVAMTDSVHRISAQMVPIKVSDFLIEISRNWVSSDSRLDMEEYTPTREIRRVSAGTEKHELTSHCCIDSVFRYFDEAMRRIHNCV